MVVTRSPELLRSPTGIPLPKTRANLLTLDPPPSPDASLHLSTSPGGSHDVASASLWLRHSDPQGRPLLYKVKLSKTMVEAFNCRARPHLGRMRPKDKEVKVDIDIQASTAALKDRIQIWVVPEDKENNGVSPTQAWKDLGSSPKDAPGFESHTIRIAFTPDPDLREVKTTLDALSEEDEEENGKISILGALMDKKSSSAGSVDLTPTKTPFEDSSFSDGEDDDVAIVDEFRSEEDANPARAAASKIPALLNKMKMSRLKLADNDADDDGKRRSYEERHLSKIPMRASSAGGSSKQPLAKSSFTEGNVSTPSDSDITRRIVDDDDDDALVKAALDLKRIESKFEAQQEVVRGLKDDLAAAAEEKEQLLRKQKRLEKRLRDQAVSSVAEKEDMQKKIEQLTAFTKEVQRATKEGLKDNRELKKQAALSEELEEALEDARADCASLEGQLRRLSEEKDALETRLRDEVKMEVDLRAILDSTTADNERLVGAMQKLESKYAASKRLNLQMEKTLGEMQQRWEGVNGQLESLVKAKKEVNNKDEEGKMTDEVVKMQKEQQRMRKEIAALENNNSDGGEKTEDVDGMIKKYLKDRETPQEPAASVSTSDTNLLLLKLFLGLPLLFLLVVAVLVLLKNPHLLWELL